MTMLHMSFNKPLILMNPNHKTINNDVKKKRASSLTAKELEKFLKNYKSPIGSESGYPSLIIFVWFFQALCHFLPVLPESQ